MGNEEFQFWENRYSNVLYGILNQNIPVGLFSKLHIKRIAQVLTDTNRAEHSTVPVVYVKWHFEVRSISLQ